MNDRFTPEQQEFLNRSARFASFSRLEVWKDLKAHMDELVMEALQDMKKMTYKTPVDERMLAQLRWQQRGSMRDTLVAFVENMVETRAEMLREEPNEYSSYADAN